MTTATIEICQSCGMPLKTHEDHGTNTDGTENSEYCKYCLEKGEFISDVQLDEFIEQQIQIAVTKLGMEEKKARIMAEETLPNLKRWSK